MTVSHTCCVPHGRGLGRLTGVEWELCCVRLDASVDLWSTGSPNTDWDMDA